MEVFLFIVCVLIGILMVQAIVAASYALIERLSNKNKKSFWKIWIETIQSMIDDDYY